MASAKVGCSGRGGSTRPSLAPAGALDGRSTPSGRCRKEVRRFRTTGSEHCLIGTRPSRAYDGGAGVIADMPAPFVFLSYGRHDRDFVARLVADLRAKGIDVWSEPLERDADPCDEARTAALGRAQTLLVVVSDESITSPRLLAEVDRALADKRRVVPLLVSARARRKARLRTQTAVKHALPRRRTRRTSSR